MPLNCKYYFGNLLQTLAVQSGTPEQNCREDQGTSCPHAALLLHSSARRSQSVSATVKQKGMPLSVVIKSYLILRIKENKAHVE